MAFREQTFRELCGQCKQAAEGACPRCTKPLCAAHAFPPDGCCEPCAIAVYLEVSRAGKKHLTAGIVLGGLSTAVFYVCWQIGYLPASVLTAVIAGFAASVATMAWGGAVAPRLSDRRLRRALAAGRARAALPGASGGEGAGAGAGMPERGA
ncbi:hypothetical protein [Haliangium sp.]|uniref:hypothetical protein n=1 Tax=Haliangium sp. TaxID=2663208 RepID=UPI003D134B62